MKACNSCGSQDHLDEARFCRHCGAALEATDATEDEPTGAQAKDQIDSEEAIPYDAADSQEEYRQAVGQALADGIIDDDRDRTCLDELRRRLRISEDQASALEDEVLATGAARDETICEGKQFRWPLQVEINDNQFFAERMVGPIDFRLRNVSSKPVRNASLIITGSYFGSAEKTYSELEPNAQLRHQVNVVPPQAGRPAVDLELAYEQDGEITVLSAQAVFKVMSQDVAPANIVIDQSVHADGGSKLGFGLSIRNEVAELVKDGLVRSINDLITQEFPDRWMLVQFRLDAEETKRRRRDPGARRVRLVQELADRRCPMSKGAMMAVDGPEARRALLLGMDTVKMGRSRENDIVLRVIPRSEANDPLTLQITSHPHCSLSLRPQGLFLADHDTLNGTQVNGCPLHGEEPLSLDSTSEIDVGKALRLRLVPFRELQDQSAVRSENYSDLGHPDDLWRLAEQLKVRSLLIQRVENLADEERYLIVYRYANIGRGMGNELIIPGEGLERTHARVIRLGGQFWLKSLVEGDRLTADGVPIPRGHAAPLAPGMMLRYGDLSGRFEEFRQIGL